ncbi:hypothetical protein [Tatumella sp. UBA2305]|nr:hypothetical protein [Tatumella sp. UBA2305]
MSEQYSHWIAGKGSPQPETEGRFPDEDIVVPLDFNKTDRGTLSG